MNKDLVVSVLSNLGIDSSKYDLVYKECAPVLINCLEQTAEKFVLAEDDFNGENGMLCNPTNWNYANSNDYYFEVVSNDWNSVTFKVDDETYFKVPRRMIYEWKIRE